MNTQDTEEMSVRCVDSILKEWGPAPNRIKALEMQIEAIEKDYNTIHGMSDNQIKASTRTNETHDLSDNMVSKQSKIDKIQESIDKIKFNMDIVDNAIDTLKEQDRELVIDKYRKRISTERLIIIYDVTSQSIYYRLRNIAKDLRPLLKAIIN